MGRFTDGNVVVVGTGSAIGRRLCLDLKSEGAEVYALGRRPNAVLAAAGASCSPFDVARAALDLLSDDARWVAGQVLAVDGGMSSVRLF